MPPETEMTRSEFADLCHERGIRTTHQRYEVYRALAGDPTHPCVDVLYRGLRDDNPTLSLATIYRILESFEGAGLVRRVSTHDGAARFDARTEPHDHLVCRSCGSIQDIARSQSHADYPLNCPPDFAAEEIDIRIVGLCAPCQASA